EVILLCDNDAPSRAACPPTPGPTTSTNRSDKQGNSGDTAGPPRGMTVEDWRGITEQERGCRRIHDGKLAEFCVVTHWCRPSDFPHPPTALGGLVAKHFYRGNGYFTVRLAPFEPKDSISE